MRNGVSKAQSGLSPTDQRMLGYLVAHVGPDGTFAMTNRALAKALGISESTAKRALRHLQEVGLIELVAEGGGRGNPSRYRIVRTRSEPVHPLPGSYALIGKPRSLASDKWGKPGHGELVHEPVYISREADQAGQWVGQELVGFMCGLVRGAIDTWRNQEQWVRDSVVVTVLSAVVGGIAGYLAKGRQGAMAGIGIGAVGGGVMANVFFRPLPKAGLEAPKALTPTCTASKESLKWPSWPARAPFSYGEEDHGGV